MITRIFWINGRQETPASPFENTSVGIADGLGLGYNQLGAGLGRFVA
jgi:hypothetical protein